VCAVASATASAVSPPVKAAAVAKTIMVLRNIDVLVDATALIPVKNMVTTIRSDCMDYSD
jgi:hypothetical protein